MDRRSPNTDEHVVLADLGLGDLAKVNDVGRAVGVLDDRFHLIPSRLRAAQPADCAYPTLGTAPATSIRTNTYSVLSDRVCSRALRTGSVFPLIPWGRTASHRSARALLLGRGPHVGCRAAGARPRDPDAGSRTVPAEQSRDRHAHDRCRPLP